MDADLKKILKAFVLEMRHALEGRNDNSGVWQPGNLEQRLAEIGVRKDRSSVPVDELPRLFEVHLRARLIVDGYLKLREQAGVLRDVAVSEFVRESAYTWANRLLTLRCMEARELIDEAILQKDSYGGRSLEHHRMIQRNRTLSESFFTLTLMAISQHVATLMNLQLSGSSINPLALELSNGSSPRNHNRACVSSSRFTPCTP